MKMKQQLKIGVIGTGHMGRNHVRNLADEGRFDLVGIYDANMEQAQKIAEEYGTKAFSTMNELLDEIDSVVVAVPSSLHKEVGLQVAEHGVHALIEKPLATNSKDAEEIAEAFEKKNLILAVGHIERFNPVIQELDKLLDNKSAFYIEIHRYSPFSGSGRITDTSVVEDLMIHDIELACHLMAPNSVKSIHGVGESIRSDNIDFATCTLKFDANTHAVISASRVSQDKERTIGVHTKDSFIYADLLGKNLTISQNTEMMVDGAHDSSYKQNGIVQKVFVPIQEPLRTELKAFYKSVVEGLPVLVDGRVGIQAIKICEAVVDEIRKEN